MDKMKKAADFMAERKGNCAQSVFRVFSEEYGLDKKMALSIAQGFGGGMHINGACGAVTGALMVLGLASKAYQEDPKAIMDKVRALTAEFVRRFKELHGAVNCTELIGYDLSNPAQAKEAREGNVFTTKCPMFVNDAVKILETLLKQK
jgi:C_GCAxxG_C_C family probable redox protein